MAFSPAFSWSPGIRRAISAPPGSLAIRANRFQVAVSRAFHPRFGCEPECKPHPLSGARATAPPAQLQSDCPRPGRPPRLPEELFPWRPWWLPGTGSRSRLPSAAAGRQGTDWTRSGPSCGEQRLGPRWRRSPARASYQRNATGSAVFGTQLPDPRSGAYRPAYRCPDRAASQQEIAGRCRRPWVHRSQHPTPGSVRTALRALPTRRLTPYATDRTSAATVASDDVEQVPPEAWSWRPIRMRRQVRTVVRTCRCNAASAHSSSIARWRLSGSRPVSGSP